MGYKVTERGKEKQRRGVIVTLSADEDGVRVSLDDVQYLSGAPLGSWEQCEHYTSKVIQENTFDELTFDEKELADFGYAILARLYAFKKRGEA